MFYPEQSYIKKIFTQQHRLLWVSILLVGIITI